MRLDRFLANMGCGSRNDLKQSIKAGKASVNDQIIRDSGFQVSVERDRVFFEGEFIFYQQYSYFMLNKPAGIVSATEDSRERTVIDLLESRYQNKGIFPVGRLDKDTEGLLILTNDGVLGHKLLSPKRHVVKRYYAEVNGEVNDEDCQAFRSGILLEDGYRTLPGNLEILVSDLVSKVIVSINEGKFHQVKRMFLALGKEVVYLKRITMGKLEIDPALSIGEYRKLNEVEIEILRQSGGSMI